MGYVLVLDGSPTIRSLLEMWLLNANHMVTTYASTPEMVRSLGYRLANAPNNPEDASFSVPDLMIIELNGLARDGYDVLGEIRSVPTYREIPIIVISGRDSQMDSVQAKLLGVQACLVKPFVLQDLLPLVHHLLQNKRK